MSEASNNLPIERPWNRGDPTRRCKAYKKNGEQCRRWAIRGGVVCRYHGGSAKHVLAAARERIALAAEHNVSNVQKLADSAESEGVRLQANNSLLDRAGLNAKQELEVSVEPAPWEELMSDVMQITRAQHEALKRGELLPPAPELPPTEILDAELVPELVDAPPDVDSPGLPKPPWADDPEALPARSTGQLVTLEDAQAEANAINRRARVVQVRRRRR